MHEALPDASERPLPSEQGSDNGISGANSSARILIVDDDFEMCHAILDCLAAQNLRWQR
jgi:hypothetical protein